MLLGSSMKRSRIIIQLDSSSDEEDKGKDAPACSICLDNLVPGHNIHRFPCAHELHATCYSNLVAHAKAKRQRTLSCPICRTEVHVRIRPSRNQVVIDLESTPSVPPESRRSRVRRRNRERQREMNECDADAEERTAIRQGEDLHDETDPALFHRLLGDGYGQSEVSDYESDEGFVVDNAEDDEASSDDSSEPEYDGSDSSSEEARPRRRARIPDPLVSEGGRLMRRR